jgi:hypothetical protein
MFDGTFSNRSSLGHPLFLAVPLVDPTEMLHYYSGFFPKMFEMTTEKVFHADEYGTWIVLYQFFFYETKKMLLVCC